MLQFSANDIGVDLQAEIDQQSNLDLIQRIYGDKRRYVQLLLNFLSNSLKFTNRGGKIKARIKIIDNQLITKKHKRNNSIFY